NELSPTDLAALKAQIRPVLDKILSAKPTAPLYLSAQLLAAQWKLGPGDAGSVRKLFISADQPRAERLRAVEVLIAFNDPSLLDALAQTLTSESTSFLGQVLAVVGNWDEPKVADVVLAHYFKMDPELQPLAIELLLQRQSWTRKLLNSVLDKRLPAGVLDRK